MIYVYIICGVLILICAFVFTQHLWDKPKDTVDMMAKFDTIVKKGLSLGKRAKVIELRENFIKIGVRDKSGESAYMVKQRPGAEFRVMYILEYNKEYKDLKINHVYPDDADQNEILAQFDKEIAESLVKR